MILTAQPAGPPFRPVVGKVEDLSPYPGFGAACRDDTTTNKHRTSTQHLLPTPHVRYMGNTCGGDKTSPCIDVSTECHTEQTTVQYKTFILIKCQDFIENVECSSKVSYVTFFQENNSGKPCAFRNILNILETYPFLKIKQK